MTGHGRERRLVAPLDYMNFRLVPANARPFRPLRLVNISPPPKKTPSCLPSSSPTSLSPPLPLSLSPSLSRALIPPPHPSFLPLPSPPTPSSLSPPPPLTSSSSSSPSSLKRALVSQLLLVSVSIHGPHQLVLLVALVQVGGLRRPLQLDLTRPPPSEARSGDVTVRPRLGEESGHGVKREREYSWTEELQLTLDLLRG